MPSVLSSSPTRTARTVGFTPAQFDAFIATRNEPGWITDRRRAAFEIYEQKLAEPLNPEEYKRQTLARSKEVVEKQLALYEKQIQAQR